MDKNEPVYYLNRRVGTAYVCNNGLYVQIKCICSFQEQRIYKVFAECDNHQIPLGIPIPQNGRYILEKRIPAKHISGNNIRFYALCKDGVSTEDCYGVSEDIAFDQLADINEGAYLRKDGGVMKIVIPAIRQ